MKLFHKTAFVLLLVPSLAFSASLLELSQLYSKGTDGSKELFDEIVAAVLVAADTIYDEDPGTTNHTNRVIWAKQALQNPVAKAEEMYGAVLAENSGAAVSAIEGASDASIQSNVDAAIDLFADGN